MSTNAHCFKIHQEAKFLSTLDKSVLALISSYSTDLHRKQTDIADVLRISVRTLQRSIKNLLKYGLIKRWYGVFKRVSYQAVSIAEQLNILKNPLSNLLKNVFKKKRNKPIKSNVLTSVSELNATLESEPTKEILKEEITTGEPKKFAFKSISIEENRRIQLEKARLRFQMS